MHRFVQILRPAADGQGMTLDNMKLRQIMYAEEVKSLPVVVLAAAGPRGSGKTTLLSAVQRVISGRSGTPSAGMAPGMAAAEMGQSSAMVPEKQSATMRPEMQSTGMAQGTTLLGMGPRVTSSEVAQVAGMGLGAQTAAMGPGMQTAAMGPGMRSVGMGPGIQTATMGPEIQPAGVGPRVQPAGMDLWAQTSGRGPGMQLPGMEPVMQSAGMGSGTQSAGTGPKTSWTGPERVACEADRPGSAGAAVWPELLPVVLPSGERAALLLLDTWGPFDDSCPEQQRASVLLFSALVSSTLVVVTSASRPVCPLGDLALLAKLGAAAQDVRHCTPLQELILLMRSWRGAAQPGRQADFRPLQSWADGDKAANQALGRMMDATDWYNEGDAFLFLAPDQATGAADPVRLLAVPKAAKRFDLENVSAGELADYFSHMATALATAPCDAASLLQSLIDGNQRLAAQAARPVYEEKMKQLATQWQQGPVSEQELCGTHNRAAHDALMAFAMSRKMDSESTDSEKWKSDLQQWLEEQYAGKRKAILTDTDKLEKEKLEQRHSCKDRYEALMKDALNESPRMTMAELIRNHERCRQEVMSEFDRGSRRQSYSQQRIDLSDDLEVLFRKFANQLDRAKEEAEADKAKKSLVTNAEKRAEKLYRDIMEAVKPEQLSTVHRLVQECAELQFDSKTKDMSEEHRSTARQRLVKRNEDTLQNLLAQAQRNAFPSHMAAVSVSAQPQAVPGSGAGSRGFGAGKHGHGAGNHGHGAGNQEYGAGIRGYAAGNQGYVAGNHGYAYGNERVERGVELTESHGSSNKWWKEYMPSNPFRSSH